MFQFSGRSSYCALENKPNFGGKINTLTQDFKMVFSELGSPIWLYHVQNPEMCIQHNTDLNVS